MRLFGIMVGLVHFRAKGVANGSLNISETLLFKHLLLFFVDFIDFSMIADDVANHYEEGKEGLYDAHDLYHHASFLIRELNESVRRVQLIEDHEENVHNNHQGERYL